MSDCHWMQGSNATASINAHCKNGVCMHFGDNIYCGRCNGKGSHTFSRMFGQHTRDMQRYYTSLYRKNLEKQPINYIIWSAAPMHGRPSTSDLKTMYGHFQLLHNLLISTISQSPRICAWSGEAPNGCYTTTARLSKC